MEVLITIVFSLVSFITLLVLTKLSGNREISSMTLFDYITSITIGSIAAELATTEFDGFFKPLIAILIWGFLTFAIAAISNKSLKFRRFMSGKTLTLYKNGKFYRENFKKARLDLSEFLLQSRINGHFSLSEIQEAQFETNGQISFCPMPSKKPLTPQDAKIAVQPSSPEVSLIMDGVVIHGNLKQIGKEEKWLKEQLKIYGIHNTSNVFLALWDKEDNFHVYEKYPNKK